MTQSLSVRATSVSASALLVGLAIFAAITATTTVWRAEPGYDIPPPISFAPEPPPPTPPDQPRRPQSPVRETPNTQYVQPVDLNTDAPSTLTTIDFGVHIETGPVAISTPHWTRRPSDLARYYPARALARGIEGGVTLDCVVRVTGALDCTPVSETPTGWGFADAALRISRDHAMTPAMRNGVPVEGRYTMRVPFDVN